MRPAFPAYSLKGLITPVSLCKEQYMMDHFSQSGAGLADRQLLLPQRLFFFLGSQMGMVLLQSWVKYLAHGWPYSLDNVMFDRGATHQMWHGE